MARRRTGLPEGFTLDLEKPAKPQAEPPIRVGDYLDDIDPAAATSTPPPTQPKNRETRARLNISVEGRKRLGVIAEHMAKYGPEPDVRISDITEALVLALYDTRANLDLSNVRRRGRFGSATHKAFPIALAESITKAMAAADRSTTPPSSRAGCRWSTATCSSPALSVRATADW